MRQQSALLSLVPMALALSGAVKANSDQFQVWSCHVLAENEPSKLLRLELAFSNLRTAGSIPEYFRMSDPNNIFARARPLTFYLDQKIEMDNQPSVSGIFRGLNGKDTFFFRANAGNFSNSPEDNKMGKAFAIIGFYDGGAGDAKLIYSGDCNIAVASDRNMANKLFSSFDQMPAIETVDGEIR